MQADLGFHSPHMPEDMFSHGAASFINGIISHAVFPISPENRFDILHANGLTFPRK